MRSICKIIFTAALVTLLFGCSIIDRIVVYEPEAETGYEKKQASLLFAPKSFSVVSIDGDNKKYYPTLTPGAYGGSHIYLKPGMHEIAFKWGGRVDAYRRIYLKAPLTVRQAFKAGHYYELYSSHIYGEVKSVNDLGFTIRDMGAIPDPLPTTGWDRLDMYNK